MFNDRIYSTKRAASALPSDKNKRVSRSGRRRGAAAPEAGPERRSGALNHDERDLRRPPHPMVQFICAGTTPERRKLKRPRAQRPWGWKGNDGRRLDAVNCDGPDVMVVWNGSRPSLGVGAASHAQRPPSRRRGAGARLHEIDDSGLSRRARRVEADGVDEERSQLLPWLELGGRGVARGQRVPPHPLYLPVPVPTRSYERRVFARASTLSLRTSQPLGSFHNSAYSRSGGHSKTAIPSQRASKRINLASP